MTGKFEGKPQAFVRPGKAHRCKPPVTLLLRRPKNEFGHRAGEFTSWRCDGCDRVWRVLKEQAWPSRRYTYTWVTGYPKGGIK